MSQTMEALALANSTRQGTSALKREVREGKLSLREAVEDERAQSLPLFEVLCQPLRRGPQKARLVLRQLGASELRRIRDLSDRQRDLLRGLL